jgi:amino acid transporter
VKQTLHRTRNKVLGIPELIAIALGGMVGGGIFTILGISVSMIGVFTPVAIILGGIIALLAAYSYIKLALFYKDEGATYSFFKKTFPHSPFAASLIGWWVVFGYISTLALYAYTFASYTISGFHFADSEWVRKGVAGGILFLFMGINLWSVKGMGKLEDVMVYTKLIILAIISFVLINNSQTTLPQLYAIHHEPTTLLSIFIVTSITFVAYEGFQLVIHAMEEMENPMRNIPLAIYSAIMIAIVIYVVIAIGTILAIPFDEIIQNKEYALAAGTGEILGHWGTQLVILGAMLATSSAISGTLFGSARLMAVIAKDGFLPLILEKRKAYIPVYAIITISLFAFLIILSGSLETILEFGSITFLMVSLLMAYANYTIRNFTNSSSFLTLFALFILGGSTLLIFYFEFDQHPKTMFSIISLYLLLTLGAWIYAKKR